MTNKPIERIEKLIEELKDAIHELRTHDTAQQLDLENLREALADITDRLWRLERAVTRKH